MLTTLTDSERHLSCESTKFNLVSKTVMPGRERDSVTGSGNEASRAKAISSGAQMSADDMLLSLPGLTSVAAVAAVPPPPIL